MHAMLKYETPKNGLITKRSQAQQQASYAAAGFALQYRLGSDLLWKVLELLESEAALSGLQAGRSGPPGCCKHLPDLTALPQTFVHWKQPLALSIWQQSRQSAVQTSHLQCHTSCHVQSVLLTQTPMRTPHVLYPACTVVLFLAVQPPLNADGKNAGADQRPTCQLLYCLLEACSLVFGQ